MKFEEALRDVLDGALHLVDDGAHAVHSSALIQAAAMVVLADSIRARESAELDDGTGSKVGGVSDEQYAELLGWWCREGDNGRGGTKMWLKGYETVFHGTEGGLGGFSHAGNSYRTLRGAIDAAERSLEK